MNRPDPAPTSSRAQVTPRHSEHRIGPWRLVRKLGEGTYTEVYQATPRACPRERAADYVVKLLKPTCQNDPVAVQLIQREAFVAQQVRHPHLSSILSDHTDSMPRFLVMPYISGVSIAEVLKVAGAFGVSQALWVVRQASEALQALHEQGWIHGDVKPANIIVSTSGHATLADLGLARSLDAARSSKEVLTGSLRYACPETFNLNVDYGPESDVYSLGVTLFELLTASSPFADDEPTELAAAHLTRPAPDPRQFVPHLPPRVSRLVRRMLAKDPLRRPSVRELVDWLVDLEVATFSERLSA